MQRAHEEIVQGDVGDAGHRDEIHGAFGVPQPPKDGADDVIGGDEGDAHKTDGEIVHRTCHRCLRGGHDGHDGTDQKEQEDRQYQGEAQKEGGGVADAPCRPLHVPGAHGLANGDGGAHGEAHDHDGQHVHHLGAYGYGGGAGHPLKLADDEEVGHAVESLQKIGEKIGQREGQNRFPDAACGKIFPQGSGPLFRVNRRLPL